MKYIIYILWETSEEELKLMKKKNYNKIILISDVGVDKAGKDFATNARNIIGSNIIIMVIKISI